MEEKFIGFCDPALGVLELGHLLPFAQIIFILCTATSELLGLTEGGDFLIDLFDFLFLFLLFEFGQLESS